MHTTTYNNRYERPHMALTLLQSPHTDLTHHLCTLGRGWLLLVAVLVTARMRYTCMHGHAWVCLVSLSTTPQSMALCKCPRLTGGEAPLLDEVIDDQL